MVGESASKAEVVGAFAVHGRDNAVEIALLDPTFECVDTVWCWTPLEVVFVVHV